MNHEEKKAALVKLRDKPGRYHAVGWSDSAHCCFDASVLDTQEEHGNTRADSPNFKIVCECFDAEDATRIARLLNEAAQ